MSKKIFVLSLLFLLIGAVFLSVEVSAFDELEKELEKLEEEESQRYMNIQAVSEIQMIDIGLPWVGGRFEIPSEINIPGREINPDYITLEGLYKLDGYDDKTAFQGRGSFKYDVGGDMYTQLGVGYLNVDGVGGLTGVAKTGLELSPGGLALDAGLVGQRTLLGAVVDEYDRTFWLGVNIGIGF